MLLCEFLIRRAGVAMAAVNDARFGCDGSAIVLSELD